MVVKNSAEIFWSRVDIRSDNECWLWMGYRHIKGYGHMSWNGKLTKVHRIAYMLSHGIIHGGLSVLHKCDNPPCCNPNHLFLGTQEDNMSDMKSKGRARRSSGEQNSKAKLTWSKVREIRQLHQNGTPQIVLAKMYGVTPTSICDIVNYKQWKE